VPCNGEINKGFDFSSDRNVGLEKTSDASSRRDVRDDFAASGDIDIADDHLGAAAANAKAVSRPIPLAPPVTVTTFSAKSKVMQFLPLQANQGKIRPGENLSPKLLGAKN